MNFKVSIITSVYNSEKYLENYFESILNQSYTNLEVICIDDGSTDTSFSILKKYSNIDERIRIFKVDHQGFFKCRNLAYQKASGDYFTIVDSDDWLHKNAIENAITQIISNNVEVSLYRLNYFYKNEDQRLLPYYGNKIISNLEALEKSIDWSLSAFGVYHKKLIPFAITKSDDFMVDELHSRILIYKANKIGINDGIYFYRQDTSSYTRSLSIESIKILENQKSIKAFLIENNVYNELKDRYLLQYSKLWIGLLNRFFKENTTQLDKREYLSQLHKLKITFTLKSIFSLNIKSKEYLYILFMNLPFSLQKLLLKYKL